MDFLSRVSDWFTDGDHWSGNSGIPNRLVEHLWLSVTAMAVALAIALPIGLWLGHTRRGGTLAVNVSNVGRAIPSFALLVLGAQFWGIGEVGGMSKAALLALIALAIPPIITNTYVGMSEVDEGIRDSAAGVGMRSWQRMVKVEMPIALPLIMAGIRISALQVVATATLAAVVASGGLGRFIVDGIAVRDFPRVFAGALLVAALALSIEALLALSRARHGVRGVAGRGSARRSATRPRRTEHPNARRRHSRNQPKGIPVTKSARWLFAAVFVTFSLVAAACGDDSDSSASSSAPAESTPAESTPAESAPASAAPAIVFKALDAGGPLTTGALESGDIDIALMFSSQGVISANGWVVLEDDKQLQPVENLVPVVRTEVAESTIGLAEVLNTVSASLTTEELAALNLRVDQDKEDPAVVAEDFLTEKGLIGEEVGSDGLAGLSITVGSANFSEQEIVANMYALVLRNNSADVTTKFQLGSREVVAPALETGEIDVYPEYVGSYLTFLGGEPTGDLDETMELLIAATEPIGVTPLDPSPAADANALVVTQETADTFGLTTISDLATVTEQLTLGGPPECPERPLCILGFEEVYGLTFEV